MTKFLGRVGLTACVALLVSCQLDPVATGSSGAPLVSGRTLTVLGRAGANSTTFELVTIPLDDPSSQLYQGFFNALGNACRDEIGTRFDSPLQDSSPVGNADCARSAANEQAIDLCIGYLLLGFAEAQAPTDVYEATAPESNTPTDVFRVRRPGDDPEDPSLGRHVATIPVLPASDAASAARMAVVAAQFGIHRGADAVATGTSPKQLCADGEMLWRVPSGSDTVTLGFVIASQTNELLHLMRESGEAAERFIQASSQARLAQDQDAFTSRSGLWRARIDSRLEIANMWLGVPDSQFDGSSSPGALVSIGTFPIVTHFGATDAYQRGLDLLRELRVDPNPGATPIEDRVKAAYATDHPNIVADMPDFATLPAGTFVERLGTTTDDLHRAAASLVEQAAVLHRPITLVPSTGRVVGTDARQVDLGWHHVFASTTGSTVTDTGATDDVSQTSYTWSIAGTFDLAHAALTRATSTRTDFDLHAAPIIALGSATAADAVNQRVRVCAGAETGTGSGRVQTSLEVMLYGVGAITDDQANTAYELWASDNGARCVLSATGTVEGVRCDPASFRLTATPQVITTDASTGLPQHAVKWQLDATSYPAAFQTSGGFDASVPVFLVERQPLRAPTILSGFTAFGGGTDGSASRCTFLPVGSITESGIASVTPSAQHAQDPHVTCTGVRDDVGLPLEDQIAEAGTHSQVVEDVFMHYLDRAEQAAAREEDLGQRLISEQLEMDQVAQTAAQRLNQICGTHLAASAIPINPPNGCMSATDCPPDSDHPMGVPCVSGACQVADITTYLSGVDDAEVSMLRRCLGEEGLAQAATLGQTPLCGWFVQATGDLCGCPSGVECPPDLRCLVADTSAHGDCDGVFAVPDAPGWDPASDAAHFRVFHSTALSVVPGRSDGVPSPLACRDLALVRRGLGRDGISASDLATQVLGQSWLNQRSLQTIAAALGINRELGGFWSVTRGGRQWFSSGSAAGGPSDPAGFPCTWHPSLSSDDVTTLCPGGSSLRSDPIACGFASCANTSSRVAALNRLDRALVAAGLLASRPVHRGFLVNTRGTASFDTSFPIGPYAEAGAYPGGSLAVTGLVHQFDVARSVPGSSASALQHYSAFCLDGVSSLLSFTTWGNCINFANPSVYFDDGYLTPPPALYDPAGLWYPFGPGTQVTTLDTWDQRRGNVGALLRTAAADASFDMHGVLPRLDNYDARQLTDTGLPDGGVDITYESELDALELACMSRLDGVGGCPADLSRPVNVSSVEDMQRLAAQLRCVAERFDQIANHLVFVDVPAAVARDIHDGGVTGTFPAFGGDYGTEVAGLRSDMEDIVRSEDQVAAAIGQFANDVELAQSRYRQEDLERQIVAQQQQAEMWNSIFGCLASAAPSLSTGTNVGVTVNTGAVFVCANAAVQTFINDRISDLRTMMSAEDTLQTEVQLSETYGERAHQLADATHMLAQATSSVNARLARMATLRQEARQELSSMLFLTQDDVGQELALNAHMRAHMSQTRVQFEEAHANALRMTYLARRAIEQRLGINLAELRTPMTLVEAPAQWVDLLCTLSGVDFNEVWRDPTTGLPSRSDTPGVPRGLETVADYVARLRLFLDSYLIDYPFVNGADTVVLSLSSDLLHPRIQCSVDSYNRLRGTELLTNAGATDGNGWEPACATADACPVVGPASLPEGAQLFAVRTPLSTDTSCSMTCADGLVCVSGSCVRGLGARALGGGAAFDLRIHCDPLTSTCGGPLGTGGTWGETVDLTSGRYLLSWYEQENGAACAPRLEASVTPADGGVSAAIGSGACASSDRWSNAGSPGNWRRIVTSVTVPPGGGRYRVAWAVASGLPVDTSGNLHVTFGAPQLEPVDASAAVARPYFPTDAQGTAPVGLCPDPTGGALRSLFTYRCAQLCTTGLGGSCPDGAESEQCFWETHFAFDIGAIERGDLIPTGGFAVGNFNYRADTLAINLVGTGVRDCSAVADSAACYASGFIPFSLAHDGPFHVRNHFGQSIDLANLSPIVAGRISFAKALTAERYLTNPISSADRALLSDEWRTEFQGRPLDGQYTLRIHDTPGLRWDRIEDVQIVLNYRYWTRQER